MITPLFMRMLCNKAHTSASLAEELWKMRKKEALSVLFGRLNSDSFKLQLLLKAVLNAVWMYSCSIFS